MLGNQYRLWPQNRQWHEETLPTVRQCNKSVEKMVFRPSPWFQNFSAKLTDGTDIGMAMTYGKQIQTTWGINPASLRDACSAMPGDALLSLNCVQTARKNVHSAIRTSLFSAPIATSRVLAAIPSLQWYKFEASLVQSRTLDPHNLITLMNAEMALQVALLIIIEREHR